jgi:hypothetical protein
MATSSEPSVAHDVPAEGHAQRVQQIYPPDGSAAQTTIDIFAIHGLDTTSQKTWNWSRKGKGKDVNWLQDDDMLPHAVPNARVFTCDWPSRLYRDLDSVEMAIPELARGLLLDIQSARSQRQTPSDHPLMFIASCLGGIVLSQAITIAAKSDSDYHSLYKSISAIIFLATPFRGTSLAYYFNVAVMRLSVEGFFRGKALSSDLLDSVGQSTTFLEDMVRDLTKEWVARDRHRPIYCFYENKPTELVKKVLPEWLAKRFADPKLVRLEPTSESEFP